MNTNITSDKFQGLKANNFLCETDPKAYKAKLEEKVELLKKLCHEIDPYIPLSEEHKASLSALEITNIDDPFSLTNQLLMLTEDTLEELESL